MTDQRSHIGERAQHQRQFTNVDLARQRSGPVGAGHQCRGPFLSSVTRAIRESFSGSSMAFPPFIRLACCLRAGDPNHAVLVRYDHAPTLRASAELHRNVATNIAPRISCAMLCGQMQLDEIAHVGKRGESHHVGNDDRPRKGRDQLWRLTGV
jgi:hypothetical protein